MSQSTQTTKVFKVCLLGEGGVGKTALAKRHLVGEFVQLYNATVGVDVSPLRFITTDEPVAFHVWDVAGQEKFGGLRDGYCVEADAAIIMFDVTRRRTYNAVQGWIDIFKRCCPGKPFVVIGNKVDVMDRKVQPREIDIHRKNNCMYWDHSVRSTYNFEKPWLYLARVLTNNPNLGFVDINTPITQEQLDNFFSREIEVTAV